MRNEENIVHIIRDKRSISTLPLTYKNSSKKTEKNTIAFLINN